jgi:hypothetical protein
MAMHSCHTTKQRASRSAHPCDQWITARELCTELNIGFNALEMMVATLEYLLQYDNARPQTSLKTVEHTVDIG